jgi:hypothetical protein
MLIHKETEAPITSSQTQSKKKPTSEKKIAANKLNGKKAHGPLDTSKTKYNAIKHGLWATGLTWLDSPAGYYELLQQLMEEKKPVGAVEIFLVERLALYMTRIPRASRMEASYIDDSIYYPPPPPLWEGPVEPRLPSLSQVTEPLVRLQRYESTYSKELLKTLHELERQQRMRLGEAVPAPSALDVNLHIDVNKDQAQAESPIIGQAFPDAKNDGVQSSK